MSNNHTQGPWNWVHGTCPCIPSWRLVSDAGEVCEFGSGDTEGDEQAGSAPSEADRNLIAAAPDLLAALRLCVSALAARDVTYSDERGDLYLIAHAAILKALGVVSKPLDAANEAV